MAFNNVKIVGNGVDQVAITNISITESVVHGLIAYNESESSNTLSIIIDGSEVITETLTANSKYTLPIKINVPVNSVLSVNAGVGVSASISYYTQAIDPAAAINSVQQLVDQAEAHVASIPDGTINDTITTTVDTWSSSKVSTELAAKLPLSGGTMTGAIIFDGSALQNLAQTQATALCF